MSYRKLTRDEHLFGPGPKRILALDGGGLRGILTLGFLAKIEAVLRHRHGDDPDFRLCHYFDLIAGTSTGSIIGSFLSIGLSVDEIITIYLRLGHDVFQKSFWRDGKIRERYDDELLSEHLRAVLGDYTAIGSKKLHTGLLVITKRLDTGSPWPLGNNPRGQYFKALAGATWISNGEYPLWQVVRASTAAPTFFSPEKMKVGQSATLEPLEGEFVDGGVSPFNDPSLQAVMYTTMKGYGIWRQAVAGGFGRYGQ